MSLKELFSYYLGANIEYNNKLKELLFLSELYDFKYDEREIVAFTPNGGKLYLKVVSKDGFKYYFALENIGQNKMCFDGGNITIGNQQAIVDANKVIGKYCNFNINRRLAKKIRVTINGQRLSGVIVNKISEELELLLNTNSDLIFIKYDYQTGEFTTNVGIDWLMFSDSYIEDIDVPDIITKYINNGGQEYSFKTHEKEIKKVNAPITVEQKKYLLMR